MNKQEILDKVVSHAREQNCRAFNLKTNLCQYKTDDGKKCFIGALIPDELYNSVFESLTLIDILRDLFNKPLLEFKDEIYSFCAQLQSIHDCNSVEEWENQFKLFANNWNLTYTPSQVENNE